MADSLVVKVSVGTSTTVTVVLAVAEVPFAPGQVKINSFMPAVFRLPVEELVALPGLAPLQAPLAVQGEPLVDTPTELQLSVVLFLIATSVTFGLKSLIATWANEGEAKPRESKDSAETASTDWVFIHRMIADNGSDMTTSGDLLFD
jgi:hypothetical protein